MDVVAGVEVVPFCVVASTLQFGNFFHYKLSLSLLEMNVITIGSLLLQEQYLRDLNAVR
jgi:hypothetical protein